MKPLKVPKKGGAKRVAKRLKELGSQPPPKEFIDSLIEDGIIHPEKEDKKSALDWSETGPDL